MEAALGPALRTTEPGPLHDARVAGRRLRAGITLFQRLYPGRWHATVDMARDVTRGFRDARDLDIRRVRLERLSRRLGRKECACRALFSRLVHRSKAERRVHGPETALTGIAFGPVVSYLWKPRRANSAESDRFAQVWLHELSVITQNTVPAASVEAHGGVQHRLRIRGKALRYSLEMMHWRLGEEARWRISVLRGVQDVLGELHDIDVFLEYIRGLSTASAPSERGCLREAAGLLGEERHRFFGRFLDQRADLERACLPVKVR
jgi:CHAD domain-containing protein